MSRLYVYLLGRNKKRIKIIAVMKGDCSAKRLNDAKVLGLPYTWEQAINNVIIEHHMKWEAWVESAPSDQALLQALKKRGYSNLNDSLLPAVNLAALIVKDMPNAKHYYLGSKPPEANHLALRKLSN